MQTEISPPKITSKSQPFFYRSTYLFQLLINKFERKTVYLQDI